MPNIRVMVDLPQNINVNAQINKTKSSINFSNSNTTTTQQEQHTATTPIEQIDLEHSKVASTVKETMSEYFDSAETKDAGQTPLSYSVKPNDTLSKIAREHHISLEELLDANPDLKSHPDEIEVDETVNIPVSDTDNLQTNFYSVQPNDTLSKIAREHHISLEELLKANPEITNPDYIEIGQSIQIPVSLEESMLNQEEICTTYTVQPHDTLSEIAQKYGLDYHYLAEINHLDNPDYIETNQQLYIPDQAKVNAYYETLLLEATEAIENQEPLDEIITKMELASQYIAPNGTDDSNRSKQNIKDAYGKLISEIINQNLQDDETVFAQLNTMNTILDSLYFISDEDLNKIREKTEKTASTEEETEQQNTETKKEELPNETIPPVEKENETNQTETESHNQTTNPTKDSNSSSSSNHEELSNETMPQEERKNSTQNSNIQSETKNDLRTSETETLEIETVPSQMSEIEKTPEVEAVSPQVSETETPEVEVVPPQMSETETPEVEVAPPQVSETETPEVEVVPPQMSETETPEIEAETESS